MRGRRVEGTGRGGGGGANGQGMGERTGCDVLTAPPRDHMLHSQ